MTDVVTSESTDVGVSSSSIDGSSMEPPQRRPSLANPVIIRVTIILTLNIFNLCGNGFTLITIRMTPRLWTKTNFILASMLAADVMTAVTMCWYMPFTLVIFVFDNPCRYNVIHAVLTSLMRISGVASIYHLILISVERYIAIIYPLHYETKFTDAVLKVAIFFTWAAGILLQMSYMLWFINADLAKCGDIAPPQYYLLEVFLTYIPVCVSLFTFYGTILRIAWRQRQRIHPDPVNANTSAARGGNLVTTTTTQTSGSRATASKDAADPTNKSTTCTELSANPATTTGTVSAQPDHQQRQNMKSRRREFKAVYLTAAIVGAYTILWFPNMVGRVLAAADYNPVVVNNTFLIGGAIGTFNFAFAWVIYAAVSKSYRRAYRQMLARIGCCCCKSVTIQTNNSVIV